MFTARLTDIYNNHHGTFFDTVTIYKDGEEIDFVRVESSEDSAPYIAAVKEAINGADFTWLPDGL